MVRRTWLRSWASPTTTRPKALTTSQQAVSLVFFHLGEVGLILNTFSIFVDQMRVPCLAKVPMNIRRTLSGIFLPLVVVLGSSGFSQRVIPSISSEQAWQYLQDQVNYGPRVPGSKSIAKTRELILTTLAGNGFTTRTQTFQAYAPAMRRHVTGVNIIGVKPPGTAAKIIFIASKQKQREIQALVFLSGIHHQE